jgi:nucleoside-diphosphate-sugar epimerase
MSRRVLLTGATGAVGGACLRRLQSRDDVSVTATSGRGHPANGIPGWSLGVEPQPTWAAGPWDVIVHTAASTRWTMTVDEARTANLESLRAILDLVGPDTHLVHVSTAYADGIAGEGTSIDPEDYRNPYEWSKALGEQLVRRQVAHRTLVRPSLVIGRRSDGFIDRFTGTYSLAQALTSGLAAVLVGDPDARVDIVPVDDVVDAVEAAVLGPPPEPEAVRTVAAGGNAPTFAELVGRACEVVNVHRTNHGVPLLEMPPFISLERWERFFLPFSHDILSQHQRRAIEVLQAFHVYTARPFTLPTPTPVLEPLQAYGVSVRYWIDRHPKVALRIPREWQVEAR